MSLEDSQTATVVADLVEKYKDPRFMNEKEDAPPELPHLAFVPDGFSVVDLTPFEDARRTTGPRRRKGTLTTTTLESFIALATRFADQHSLVFADQTPTAAKLLAVLDYHETTFDGTPRFGEHRVSYAFPFSPEWLAWTGLAAKMPQATLAEFLEEHMVDILDPGEVPQATAQLAVDLGIRTAGPAALVALARELHIRIEQKVSSATNLSTGEGAVVFEETHTQTANASGKMTVPGGFVIAIPVVEGGEPYMVICRLRYQVINAQARWTVVLHRPDRVFRDAFDGAVEKVRASIPVVYGTPEK